MSDESDVRFTEREALFYHKTIRPGKIEIIASKRDASGRWALGIVHPDEVVAEPGVAEGQPSRWNTLRALRVLDWYDNSARD